MSFNTGWTLRFKYQVKLIILISYFIYISKNKRSKEKTD